MDKHCKPQTQGSIQCHRAALKSVLCMNFTTKCLVLKIGKRKHTQIHTLQTHKQSKIVYVWLKPGDLLLSKLSSEAGSYLFSGNPCA